MKDKSKKIYRGKDGKILCKVPNEILLQQADKLIDSLRKDIKKLEKRNLELTKENDKLKQQIEAYKSIKLVEKEEERLVRIETGKEKMYQKIAFENHKLREDVKKYRENYHEVVMKLSRLTNVN